jgi:hypothetical protein
MSKHTHHIIGDENGKYRYTGQESNSGASGEPDRTDSRTDDPTTYPYGRTRKTTGIRAGEIIGSRCWHWHGGCLHSMSYNVDWDPNLPYYKAENWYGGDYHDDCGFFAFKHSKDVKKEYRPFGARVYGKIAMWGTVFEHTLGYRAEFARIVAIDEAYIMCGLWDIRSWNLRRKIRKLYNLPASFNGRTTGSEPVNRGSNP